MWHKFTFHLDQTKGPNHFQFVKEFETQLPKTEEPFDIRLSEALRDRAQKRIYYLYTEPDQRSWDAFIKRFCGEESSEPMEQTRQVHPRSTRVDDHLISAVKEIAAELGRSEDRVCVWPTKGIDVPLGQKGGQLADYDIAGEWQIECGDASFPLRLTIGDTNDLQTGNNERVKATIRQELTRA